MVRDTVNVRAVRILLECNLVIVMQRGLHVFSMNYVLTKFVLNGIGEKKAREATAAIFNIIHSARWRYFRQNMASLRLDILRVISVILMVWLHLLGNSLIGKIIFNGNSCCLI